MSLALNGSAKLHAMVRASVLDLDGVAVVCGFCVDDGGVGIAFTIVMEDIAPAQKTDFFIQEDRILELTYYV
jgi:hypothetical protein